MTKKLLPIGIQTFASIRENNYLYVDKTGYIYEMVKNPKGVYFISRPRRFGKSLLIDTIKDLFEGKKELFKGLWIENNWDWNKKHPVVKISFGSGGISPTELQKKISDILRMLGEKEGIKLISESTSGKLEELIIKLEGKYGQKVVVLVDEYDKAILDNIDDLKEASKVRDILRDFYGVLKDADSYIRLILLTGVTKLSKVNLFSGLNNLRDISLKAEFGEICGITQQEIEKNFKDYLEGVDMKKLRHWYNGFNFLGKHKVYNPFDLLLFFDGKEFKNYWFETATPTFLIKKLREGKYFVPDIENIIADDQILSSFDVDQLSVETLLFQTGYLTIKERRLLGSRYYYDLVYPNLEIKMSLTDNILGSLIKDRVVKSKIQESLYLILERGDVASLEGEIKKIFSSIPYDWLRKNNLAKYEGYYCSVIYSYFTGMGLDVTAEDVTNKGRIDLTVKLGNKIYIIEFKTEKAGKKPLEQIKERKYWEKYMVSEKRKVKSEKLKVKSEKLDGALLSEKLKVKSEEKTLTSDSSFKKRENKENVTGDNHRNQDGHKGRPYNLQPETDNRQPTTCNLFLIGIEFDEKQRNVTSFQWERVKM